MKKLLLLLFSITCFSQTIENSFEIPKKYKRIIVNDYHRWLVNNNVIKNKKLLTNEGYEVINKDYAAIFNYKAGTLTAHNSKAAAIYLNSRFKFENNQFDNINYTLRNADIFGFNSFLKGRFPATHGYNIMWVNLRVNNTTPVASMFTGYIQAVWIYSSFGSLKNFDTYPVHIKNMMPGDIFINGETNGHVSTIIDIVVNKKGNKKFMLAESSTPSSQQYILLNPKTKTVWYDISDIKKSNYLNTPTWVFSNKELARFKK